MYVCGKDCLSLIPFRLLQISCFTLSLNCFSSDTDNCPSVGIGPLLQFPHPPRAGPALLALPFFLLVPSPTKFCVALYVLSRWSGTPVHSQLMFCSACTSVSEGVFLMYQWREMSMVNFYSYLSTLIHRVIEVSLN